MMAATRDHRGLVLRLAVIGTGLLVAYNAAHAVVNATGPDGTHLPLSTIALILSPIAVYVAFRYPLIFPFGLYAALIPFDAVLSITSGATYVRLLGLLAAMALGVRILMLRRFALPPSGWYVWLAVMGWSALTIMWTPDLEETQRVFGIMLQNFMLMTVLAIYPAREFEFRWVALVMVLAGVGSAAYAIWQSLHASTYGLGRLSIVSSTGIVLDPNTFAGSFLLPIAIGVAIATTTPSLWLRIGSAAAAASMMLGVLLSGSRGGFVAIALTFGYFALRSKHRLQIIGMAVVCFGLTAFYPAIIQRFLHDPGEQGTGSGRTYIWAVGWNAIRDNWLFGTGIGSFPETYTQHFINVYQRQMQGWHRPSHDIFIGTWVELGLVGLVLVVFAWWSCFRQLRAIPREHKLYPVRVACEAAIVGLFGQSIFLDPIWIKYIWLALALPMLVNNLYAPRFVGRPAAPLR